MEKERFDLYEKQFKDHKATVEQLDENTQVLTFKKDGTKIYSIEFLFRNNMIFVSGDLGWGVFSCTWNPTWNNNWSNFYLDYFVEKCKAFFGDKIILDKDLAKKEITEYIIKEFSDEKSEEESKQLAKKLIEIVEDDPWDKEELLSDELFTEDNDNSTLKICYLLLLNLEEARTPSEFTDLVQNDDLFNDYLDEFYGDSTLNQLGQSYNTNFELWLYCLSKAEKQLLDKQKKEINEKVGQ